MTPAQADLVERLRMLLADALPREVPMFGGRSFMVNDKLAVAAQKDGGLLVRVAADRHEELLQRAGAVHAVMGPQRREMGAGWIFVDPAELDDDQLEFWVGAAMEHNGGE